MCFNCYSHLFYYNKNVLLSISRLFREFNFVLGVRVENLSTLGRAGLSRKICLASFIYYLVKMQERKNTKPEKP